MSKIFRVCSVVVALLLALSPLSGQITAPPVNGRIIVATCTVPNAGFPTATNARTPGAVMDANGNDCSQVGFGCYLVSAATTNATSCKASQGLFMGFRFINTTGTVYFLRMYNLATAPSCGSATGFVESIPIPANTSGAGVVVAGPLGIPYSTGLAFCFTGGGSSSDNTAADVGVYGAVIYK